MHTAAQKAATAGMSLLLSGMFVQPTHAQELSFFTGLFKDVHSVTLYYQSVDLRSVSGLENSPRCVLLEGLCGAGAEVLFDLSSPKSGSHLELGLGASYVGSLRTERPDSFDLRGSVRSFPTAGAYLTLPINPQWQPYVGVNFGIAELWNAQAYDLAGQEISVKGQTFEFGVTGGIYRESVIESLGLFLEGGFRWRRFSSLDYIFPKGLETAPLPKEWPRKLDLSAWQVSAGFQFDLKKDAEGAPSFQGTWILAKLNDQSLPNLLSLRKDPQDRLIREELVGATLLIEARGPDTYTLDLQIRRSTLENDKVVHVAPLITRVQRGFYEIDDKGTLCLDPEPLGGDKACTRRVGDDLLLRPVANVPPLDNTAENPTAITGNSLLFRKLK